MKRFWILSFTIITASCPIFSQTQKKDNNVLTLEECISITIQQNPLVLSSLQQCMASLARINQAKAFPQPTIDFDSDLQPKFFNFKDSGESYFGLSQSIEFPGKRYIRGK